MDLHCKRNHSPYEVADGYEENPEIVIRTSISSQSPGIYLHIFQFVSVFLLKQLYVAS